MIVKGGHAFDLSRRGECRLFALRPVAPKPHCQPNCAVGYDSLIVGSGSGDQDEDVARAALKPSVLM